MEAHEEGFTPYKEPIAFGYLAAADGLGVYPAFRYRGTEKIIVENKDEDEKAGAEGFHQVDFGSMDAPRDVDYGYDLSRLNPMQLYLYAKEIGCDINPDYTIADCVKEIQEFMLSSFVPSPSETLWVSSGPLDHTATSVESNPLP